MIKRQDISGVITQNMISINMRFSPRFSVFSTIHGCAGGVTDSGLELETGEERPSSNFSRVHDIPLRVKTREKCMNLSSPISYGLKSRIFSMGSHYCSRRIVNAIFPRLEYDYS